MKIDKMNTTPAFRGPLTAALAFLDTNATANATLIDLGAMVAPRTYIDTKKRNKYAGAETFFREFTGTLIVCLSSGLFAMGFARAANKLIDPKTNINPKSWFTDDAVSTLKKAWSKGENTKDFVSNVLNNLSGQDGAAISKLKNTKEISEKFTKYIDWNFGRKEAKLTAKEIEDQITNDLRVNRSVNVNIDGAKLNTSVENLIRDMRDMGKDIFNNKNINIENAFKKIAKVNKIKTLGALGIASVLGLTNQYINRKITEKRTGKTGFVGEVGYNSKNNKSGKDTSLKFKAEKGLVSAGIAALALAVMRVKNPKDFIKKLEFAGPVTSGNAIKTVYTATLIGRFLASDNKQELGETAFRDYFGFLNWLVLGGFAAKGAANLMDPHKKELFNIHKEGKGVKHWLNDISVKSHKEAAAKGIPMWKINTAHIAGLAYSTLMLGVVLTRLNVYFSRRKYKKEQEAAVQPARAMTFTALPKAFKEFAK
ncbi:MAG: hypothetical protein LBK53_07760 [Heliobacteriaceae bacterium]|jgi:hypothetical protein|nr:hypothetical protein [Heliobacteriaceae bacterium]